MSLITREEAQKLIEKVLSFSKAEDCQVTVGAADMAQTRFANNSITTSGRVSGAVVTIGTTIETRTGRVAVNETSDDELRAAVARSEELARFSPPDPEYMPPLGPQKYPQVASWDEATATVTQKDMMPAVRAAVEEAGGKKLDAAGYIEREAEALAFGNKRGNFGYARRTDASYTVTVRTPDGTGSGWAASRSHRFGELDAPRRARIAIDKAVLSQKPRRLEPGKYTVILEPAAVQGILGPMFGSFDARATEEGRTFLSKRGGGTLVGEKLFTDKISIRSDAFDPRTPGLPWIGGIATRRPSAGAAFFGGGGGGGFGGFQPVRRVDWVEKGVVKKLAYSRYWAAKKEVEPTPPAGSSVVVEGEDRSLEDLIKDTDRALLVTNFWYIRFLTPQTVQLTGLTRDGMFMIENGKIAYPVMNFRWNESPVRILANVEAMSRPERVSNMVVPAMRVREFTMSSISDAV